MAMGIKHSTWNSILKERKKIVWKCYTYGLDMVHGKVPASLAEISQRSLYNQQTGEGKWKLLDEMGTNDCDYS